MMCQCGFADCNKGATAVWDDHNEGGFARVCMCGGGQEYVETLYFPLNFVVNLKTDLKIKFYQFLK